MKWWMSSSFKLGLVAAALVVAAPAPAIAQRHYSGITVDASRIATADGPTVARNLSRFLHQDLQQSFGDLLTRDRRAPSLLVRLTGLKTPPLPDTNDTSDYMQGEALVVSPRGGVLARYPMQAALQASYSGAWYLPANERLRLRNLSRSYAYWLRREVGGS
jgi:hypothetical protein